MILNKDFVKFAVEVLERTDLPQGKYALHDGDEYCSLGVLLREIGTTDEMLDMLDEHDTSADQAKLYYGTMQQLFENAGYKVTKEALRRIASQNDTYCLTFIEVAEYLEQEFNR